MMTSFFSNQAASFIFWAFCQVTRMPWEFTSVPRLHVSAFDAERRWSSGAVECGTWPFPIYTYQLGQAALKWESGKWGEGGGGARICAWTSKLDPDNQETNKFFSFFFRMPAVYARQHSWARNNCNYGITPKPTSSRRQQHLLTNTDVSSSTAIRVGAHPIQRSSPCLVDNDLQLLLREGY